MRIVVTITANDRPDYLRQVLESWREVDGISDVPLVFSVEPGNDEVQELCRSVDFAEKTLVFTNEVKRGPHGNPHRALTHAFNLGADFSVLGEDDSVVATDVLDFFWTMALRHQGDPKIFTVCACNLRCGICCDRVEHVRRGAFCSTVWGLWDYRWSELSQSWGMHYADHGGWDMKFAAVVKGARDCLIPCVSRAQHIGQYGGVHMRPEEFHEMRSHCFEPKPIREAGWDVMRSYG